MARSKYENRNYTGYILKTTEISVVFLDFSLNNEFSLVTDISVFLVTPL